MRTEAQSEPDMPTTRGGAEQDRLSTAGKVAFLSAPGTHGGAAVDVRETRAAWVFLAGDRAWKLKKPVRFDHLDYSTLEARGRICAEEVRLNRRLAPDVYLGTARLTLEAGGKLAIDGSGPTIDWLVEMRRLEDARMLDQAILAGTVTAADIEAVAARLGGFYAQAPAVPVDPEAHLAHFMREIDLGSEVFADPGFGRTGERAVALAASLSAMLAGEPAIVTGRVAAGRILEGHGDLRPEHVCLEQPTVIIDCLEFSPELRLVDPFDEISFLAMECAVIGARWIGPILLDRCTTMLGDRPPGRTLAFYTAYRATLRARQALAHLLEPLPRTPGKWLPLAERYLEEARMVAPTSP
jgi:aminoglycoside phosphotransferase family enzyme